MTPPSKADIREMANAVNSSLDLCRVMAERADDDGERQTRLMTAATCIASGLMSRLVYEDGHDLDTLVIQHAETLRRMLQEEEGRP